MRLNQADPQLNDDIRSRSKHGTNRRLKSGEISHPGLPGRDKISSLCTKNALTGSTNICDAFEEKKYSIHVTQGESYFGRFWYETSPVQAYHIGPISEFIASGAVHSLPVLLCF